MGDPALFRFKDVGFQVGTFQILDGINFQLEKGEFLTILGASGAGKSSLLRLFNLLSSPTQGEISYRGHDPGADVRVLRQNVGYLFQKPAIFNASVRENLLISGRWDQGIAQTLDHELRGALDRVELSQIDLKQNARSLSGGEQQRLALARVLLNKPQVILLDEPTSSLDPKLSRAIMDLVFRLRSELSLTIVAVSHDHKLMRRYADRVILLHKGQIIESGSFQELDERKVFEEIDLDSEGSVNAS